MDGLQDAMFHVGQSIHHDLLVTQATSPANSQPLGTWIERIEALRRGYEARMGTTPDLFEGFPERARTRRKSGAPG
nr:K110 [uncultured bacterium]